MSYEELKGRTFVVTGAGSGIGKATSVLLAEQGANVALLDLRAPETVAKELEAMGCQCLALACNVQNATEVDTATKAIVSHFGALHGTQIQPLNFISDRFRSGEPGRYRRNFKNGQWQLSP